MTTIIRRLPTRWVLGIDQSYGGFAICALTSEGKHRMHRRDFTGKKTGVDRLGVIGAWVGLVIDQTPGVIEHVCMEGYAPGMKFGRESAGELAATVKLALRTSRLGDPVGYPTIVGTTALKKFVTGKGTAPKSMMLMHVYRQWGHQFPDDDQADAYGLAKIAAAVQWGDGEHLLGYQSDVLKNLNQYTER